MADKPCESINFQIVQIEISKEKICPFRVGGLQTEWKQLPGAAGMKSGIGCQFSAAAISLQQFGGVCCHLLLCYGAKSLKLSAALAQR